MNTHQKVGYNCVPSYTGKNLIPRNPPHVCMYVCVFVVCVCVCVCVRGWAMPLSQGADLEKKKSPLKCLFCRIMESHNKTVKRETKNFIKTENHKCSETGRLMYK